MEKSLGIIDVSLTTEISISNNFGDKVFETITSQLTSKEIDEFKKAMTSSKIVLIKGKAVDDNGEIGLFSILQYPNDTGMGTYRIVGILSDWDSDINYDCMFDYDAINDVVEFYC